MRQGPNDCPHGSGSGIVETTDLSLQAEALICAGLRGERPSWPPQPEPQLAEAVLERCAYHGTAALLYHQLEGAGWPEATVERLRSRAAAAALWEVHHERLVYSLLAELAARGMEPLLLKGTALAYTSYADPVLRMRTDTDLIVPPTVRAEADRILAALGFERGVQVSGDMISHQASYAILDRAGFEHVVDLHWRISNSEVLGRLFTHAELSDRAVPVPRLGPAARATGEVDSLLIACMHRQVHARSPYWVDGVAQFPPDRLIWLYDLHLLAKDLTTEQEALLVRLAWEKGLAGLCHEGLARAAEQLGTAVPAKLRAALDPGGRREVPRLYLDAGIMGREYMDFRAIAGLAGKLRFLREHVFPPADYMRARFAGVRPDWLPWLYLRRLLRGVTDRLVGRVRAGS